MIKKFFAIAAVACSMALTSCGYSVDGVISDINKCETAADLKKLTEDKDLEKWIEEQSPEDQTKIMSAAIAKGISLAASGEDLQGLLGE